MKLIHCTNVTGQDADSPGRFKAVLGIEIMYNFLSFPGPRTLSPQFSPSTQPSNYFFPVRLSILSGWFSAHRPCNIGEKIQRNTQSRSAMTASNSSACLGPWCRGGNVSTTTHIHWLDHNMTIKIQSKRPTCGCNFNCLIIYLFLRVRNRRQLKHSTRKTTSCQHWLNNRSIFLTLHLQIANQTTQPPCRRRHELPPGSHCSGDHTGARIVRPPPLLASGFQYQASVHPSRPGLF